MQEPAAEAAKRIVVDSSVVRAHRQAGGRADDRAVGRSRGGVGTKVHPVADDERTAPRAVLTGGQAHDAPAFRPALCGVPDETAATAVVADRAYDSNAIRADLEAAGSEAVIPPRKNRKDPPEYDRGAYEERERAERQVSQLKRMRRVATRCEKLGSVFPAMVHIACVASILL